MRYLWNIVILGLFTPLCWAEDFVPDSACKNNAGAKLDSLQGKVFFDPESNGHWQQAKLYDFICEGSRVKVELYSRASLSLPEGVILRLDEGTVLTLNGITQGKTTLLDLLKGFIHFISRTPRHLEITSPIANAGPEGTEFAMRVNDANASLWVYEGGVKFFNTKGSVHLKPGQEALALLGQAPRIQINIKPEDAVNWALYYPPILPYPDATAVIDSGIRKAIQDYRQGHVDVALMQLDSLSAEQQTPYFLKVRAAMRLTAGLDKLALQDIQALLAKNPNDAEALALQSIRALTQNRKEEAYALATQAVAANSQSATAYSALSYAEQGRFHLDKAQAAADQATKLAPHDAMVWARKAELELSQGLISESQQAAKKAIELNPRLGRTQTVMGFSHLLQMDTDEALQNFKNAVQLDSSSPLARLGLGLVKIRKGNLQKGRQDLEIAAILDPNNSLIRSYLGKAYFEENRNKLAEDQFNLAKNNDPKDPTPYLYDALKKQTENRPVEALQDLQQAIILNDNRAVYRSKQLLDSDRAARGASLARIYDNLGFEQRGLVEATTSLQVDPTNFSAHRFLSDTYVNQSSRETAQLSELLQAKLLQPININPVQPHLSVSQRGLLNAAGMANSSFQDFTRNFEGNRPQLLMSGVVGNLGTYSDEVTLSGLLDKFSYSLGQYHYQTNGYVRPPNKNLSEADRYNTDQHHDIYNVFFQAAVNDYLNTQFEYIHRDTEQGDFRQDFNSDKNVYSGRDKLKENIYRLGLNLRIFTDDHVLTSYIHADTLIHNDMLGDSPQYSDLYTKDIRNSLDFIEGQYLHNSQFYNVITGISFYSITEKQQNRTLNPDSNTIEQSFGNGVNNGHYGHKEYAYINLKLHKDITGIFGLSHDFSDVNTDDRQQKYPRSAVYTKAGLVWDISNIVKFRMAYYRGKPIVAMQTIEPTQIAGFNQFFDDFKGNSYSFYGGAIDFKIQPTLFTGTEFSQREVNNSTGGDFFSKTETSKIYFNWAPTDRISINSHYQYLKNKSIIFKTLITHKAPIELRYFDPSGFFSRFKGTFVSQEQAQDYNVSNFFLLDAEIGFRLPKRFGTFSLEGRNLTNQQFQFNDMNRRDNSNIFFNTSEFLPQRTFFARIVLNF